MHQPPRLVPRLAPALALALAGACADQPTSPAAPLPRTAAHLNAAVAAERYLVLSKGNAFAAGFAERVAALGGRVERVHEASGLAVVTGLSADRAAALARVAGVGDVQPDVEFTLDAPVAVADAEAATVGDPGAASQADPATAARYPFQWNMRQIGAHRAWKAGKLGSSGVTVAILDTGLDYDIADLNGLVDLSRSKSFIAGDDAITARYYPARNPINDYHGHGTNVATQVSSKAIALAGVTSRTTLLGVKVLGQNGRGSLASVIGGLTFAADQGADVANMSLGGGFAKAGNGPYVAYINRAFNYAKQKGMLVVVAAGNETRDLDHDGNQLKTYCAATHVVCVAAVGPTLAGAIGSPAADAPAYFTNFGRSAITVAAPGGNAGATVSTWPWGATNASFVWSYCPKYRIAGFAASGAPVLTACFGGNRLSGMAGTSQAAPHVAGLAALLVAEQGRGRPQAIKHAIEASSNDLGQPGTDPYYGRGRINVATALGL